MRHPPVGVAEGTCYGRSDVPLATGYLDKVRTKQSLMPSTDNMRLLCSPASRCRLAADILFPGRYSCDDRLTELDFGTWEMRPWSHLPRDQVKRWSEDLHGAVPHGGESGRQMLDRCALVLNELVEGGESAFLVSHSGFIHGILALVLDTDLAHAYRLDVDYCGLTLISVHRNLKKIRFINR